MLMPIIIGSCIIRAFSCQNKVHDSHQPLGPKREVWLAFLQHRKVLERKGAFERRPPRRQQCSLKHAGRGRPVRADARMQGPKVSPGLRGLHQSLALAISWNCCSAWQVLLEGTQTEAVSPPSLQVFAVSNAH